MRTTIAALTVILGLSGLAACRSEEPVAASTTTAVQRPVDTVSTTPTTTTTVPPVAAPVVPKPQYVVVNKGDKVPNISPPTKLYIRGVTADECDHMGGWFDDAITTCKNVDY